MANYLSYNPLRVYTAATAISSAEGVDVLAMQWLDDDGAAGGVIGDGEDLDMVINGVLVHINVLDASAVGPMAWSVEFSRPFKIYSLVVSAIAGGTLIIWKA